MEPSTIIAALAGAVASVAVAIATVAAVAWKERGDHIAALRKQGNVTREELDKARGEAVAATLDAEEAVNVAKRNAEALKELATELHRVRRGVDRVDGQVRRLSEITALSPAEDRALRMVGESDQRTSRLAARIKDRPRA